MYAHYNSRYDNHSLLSGQSSAEYRSSRERIYRTLCGSTVVRREDLLAVGGIEHPATSNSLFAFHSDVDVLSSPVAYLNPPHLLIELRTICAPNANTLPTKVVLHGQTTIAYVPHVSCINSRNVSYAAGTEPAFCLKSFHGKKNNTLRVT